jgi:hypothetical protein
LSVPESKLFRAAKVQFAADSLPSRKGHLTLP